MKLTWPKFRIISVSRFAEKILVNPKAKKRKRLFKITSASASAITSISNASSLIGLVFTVGFFFVGAFSLNPLAMSFMIAAICVASIYGFRFGYKQSRLDYNIFLHRNTELARRYPNLKKQAKAYKISLVEYLNQIMLNRLSVYHPKKSRVQEKNINNTVLATAYKLLEVVKNCFDSINFYSFTRLGKHSGSAGIMFLVGSVVTAAVVSNFILALFISTSLVVGGVVGLGAYLVFKRPVDTLRQDYKNYDSLVALLVEKDINPIEVLVQTEKNSFVKHDDESTHNQTIVIAPHQSKEMANDEHKLIKIATGSTVKEMLCPEAIYYSKECDSPVESDSDKLEVPQQADKETYSPLSLGWSTMVPVFKSP